MNTCGDINSVSVCSSASASVSTVQVTTTMTDNSYVMANSSVTVSNSQEIVTTSSNTETSTCSSVELSNSSCKTVSCSVQSESSGEIVQTQSKEISNNIHSNNTCNSGDEAFASEIKTISSSGLNGAEKLDLNSVSLEAKDSISEPFDVISDSVKQFQYFASQDERLSVNYPPIENDSQCNIHVLSPSPSPNLERSDYENGNYSAEYAGSQFYNNDRAHISFASESSNADSLRDSSELLAASEYLPVSPTPVLNALQISPRKINPSDPSSIQPAKISLDVAPPSRHHLALLAAGYNPRLVAKVGSDALTIDSNSRLEIICQRSCDERLLREHLPSMKQVNYGEIRCSFSDDKNQLDNIKPSWEKNDLFLSPQLQRKPKDDTPGRGGSRRLLRQRTAPAASSPPPMDGLAQLNQILSAMERHGELRHQYHNLKKRCEYVEEMKDLLKYRNNMLLNAYNIKNAPKKGPMALQDRKISSAGNAKRQKSDIFQDDSIRDSLIDVFYPSSRPKDHDGDLDRMGKDDLGTKWERKKSKKLKAKWEQVKKVFTGKQEIASRKLERSGTITAKELLEDNANAKIRTFSVSNDPGIVGFESTPSKVSFQGSQLEQSSPGSITSDQANESEEFAGSIGETLIKHSTSIGSIPNMEADSGISAGSRRTRTFIFPDQDQNLCPEVKDEILRSFSDPYETLQGDIRKKTALAQTESPKSLSPNDIPSGLGRSNSFRIPKTSAKSEDSPSKSVPSSPIDLDFPQKKIKPIIKVDVSLEKSQTEPVQSGNDRVIEQPAFQQQNSSQQQQPEQQQQQVQQLPQVSAVNQSPLDTTKKAKGAWDKVKDIIHTRKGSFKNKTKSSKLESQPLEAPETKQSQTGNTIWHVSGEFETLTPPAASDLATNWLKTDTQKIQKGEISSQKFLGEKRESRVSSMSPSSRSPRFLSQWKGRRERSVSPLRLGQRASRATRKQSEESSSRVPSNAEFEKGSEFSRKFTGRSRKMKFIGRAKSTEMPFSRDFIMKMEEWEQQKRHGSAQQNCRDQKIPNIQCVDEPDPARADLLSATWTESSTEHQEPVVEVLSESFSKTVQDWERLKDERSWDTRDRSRDGLFRKARDKSRDKTRDKSRDDTRDKTRDKSHDKSRDEPIKILNGTHDKQDKATARTVDKCVDKSSFKDQEKLKSPVVQNSNTSISNNSKILTGISQDQNVLEKSINTPHEIVVKPNTKVKSNETTNINSLLYGQSDIDFKNSESDTVLEYGRGEYLTESSQTAVKENQEKLSSGFNTSLDSQMARVNIDLGSEPLRFERQDGGDVKPDLISSCSSYQKEMEGRQQLQVSGNISASKLPSHDKPSDIEGVNKENCQHNRNQNNVLTGSGDINKLSAIQDQLDKELQFKKTSEALESFKTKVQQLEESMKKLQEESVRLSADKLEVEEILKMRDGELEGKQEEISQLRSETDQLREKLQINTEALRTAMSTSSNKNQSLHTLEHVDHELNHLRAIIEEIYSTDPSQPTTSPLASPLSPLPSQLKSPFSEISFSFSDNKSTNGSNSPSHSDKDGDKKDGRHVESLRSSSLRAVVGSPYPKFSSDSTSRSESDRSIQSRSIRGQSEPNKLPPLFPALSVAPITSARFECNKETWARLEAVYDIRAAPQYEPIFEFILNAQCQYMALRCSLIRRDEQLRYIERYLQLLALDQQLLLAELLQSTARVQQLQEFGRMPSQQKIGTLVKRWHTFHGWDSNLRSISIRGVSSKEIWRRLSWSSRCRGLRESVTEGNRVDADLITSNIDWLDEFRRKTESAAGDVTVDYQGSSSVRRSNVSVQTIITKDQLDGFSGHRSLRPCLRNGIQKPRKSSAPGRIRTSRVSMAAYEALVSQDPVLQSPVSPKTDRTSGLSFKSSTLDSHRKLPSSKSNYYPGRKSSCKLSFDLDLESSSKANIVAVDKFSPGQPLQGSSTRKSLAESAARLPYFEVEQLSRTESKQNQNAASEYFPVPVHVESSTDSMKEELKPRRTSSKNGADLDKSKSVTFSDAIEPQPKLSNFVQRHSITLAQGIDGLGTNQKRSLFPHRLKRFQTETLSDAEMESDHFSDLNENLSLDNLTEFRGRADSAGNRDRTKWRCEGSKRSSSVSRKDSITGEISASDLERQRTMTSPFRNSPSPIVMTKLKSAAELLEESMAKRKGRKPGRLLYAKISTYDSVSLQCEDVQEYVSPLVSARSLNKKLENVPDKDFQKQRQQLQQQQQQQQQQQKMQQQEQKANKARQEVSAEKQFSKSQTLPSKVAQCVSMDRIPEHSTDGHDADDRSSIGHGPAVSSSDRDLTGQRSDESTKSAGSRSLKNFHYSAGPSRNTVDGVPTSAQTTRKGALSLMGERLMRLGSEIGSGIARDRSASLAGEKVQSPAESEADHSRVLGALSMSAFNALPFTLSSPGAQGSKTSSTLPRAGRGRGGRSDSPAANMRVSRTNSGEAGQGRRLSNDDEPRKLRSRILEGNWFQNPKKFFKSNK